LIGAESQTFYALPTAAALLGAELPLWAAEEWSIRASVFRSFCRPSPRIVDHLIGRIFADNLSPIID
jgi:hypothetical protein